MVSVADAKPYAGIGRLTCEEFYKTQDDLALRREIAEWVQGFASGIQIGLQLSGQSTVSLEPLGKDPEEFFAKIHTHCREDGAVTISVAALQILLPIFKVIPKGE